MSTHVDFPYRYDGRGRTATTDDAGRIRDLIEQVLFTQPGERVNRPEFGSGVMHLVFAPLSDELAATTQLLVQGALQQWLDTLIAVERVDVARDEGALRVTVQYVARRDGERRVEEFVRTEGGA